MKQKPSYDDKKNTIDYKYQIELRFLYKIKLSSLLLAFRINLISPDTFIVSWHVESNIYIKWDGLNSFPSLLTEILYPDIKEVIVDLRFRTFGKGQIISDIELWSAPIAIVSEKIGFPW